MRYWWVNQNQTFRQETAGGYLWSPKRNANGARNPFYETMREVSPGDVVFSFVDTVIAAIGVAQSYSWESPKPAEFGTTGQYWENVGWKVRVQFTPLVHRVRPKDQMQVLLPVLPPRYAPLQPNGNGIQAPAVYNPALQQPAVVVGEIPEEGAKPIRCSLHWGDLGRDGHQIAVPPWCSRYFSSPPDRFRPPRHLETCPSPRGSPGNTKTGHRQGVGIIAAGIWIHFRWAHSAGMGIIALTKENLARCDFFAIVEQMAKREYLGEFEFMVILALLRLGQDAYGVEISREIERRCRGVSVGSLYATLERLESHGLVSSALGEVTPERGGRAKRYFQVTADGLDKIRESQRALCSMWDGLPQLEAVL